MDGWMGVQAPRDEGFNLLLLLLASATNVLEIHSENRRGVHHPSSGKSVSCTSASEETGSLKFATMKLCWISHPFETWHEENYLDTKPALLG